MPFLTVTFFEMTAALAVLASLAFSFRLFAALVMSSNYLLSFYNKFRLCFSNVALDSDCAHSLTMLRTSSSFKHGTSILMSFILSSSHVSLYFFKIGLMKANFVVASNLSLTVCSFSMTQHTATTYLALSVPTILFRIFSTYSKRSSRFLRRNCRDQLRLHQNLFAQSQ